jgi:hypothetical protein
LLHKPWLLAEGAAGKAFIVTSIFLRGLSHPPGSASETQYEVVPTEAVPGVGAVAE